MKMVKQLDGQHWNEFPTVCGISIQEGIQSWPEQGPEPSLATEAASYK